MKRLVLDALDIKVYAKGIDNVEVQGVIPQNYLPLNEHRHDDVG